MTSDRTMQEARGMQSHRAAPRTIARSPAGYRARRRENGGGKVVMRRCRLRGAKHGRSLASSVPVSVGERVNAALHRAPASKSPQGQIVQVVCAVWRDLPCAFDAIRV